MSTAVSAADRRLRWGGQLVLAGIAIQATTFIWAHPTAFLAFLAVGVSLVAAGAAVSLWALLGAR
jgi:hypothetical protein